MTLNLIRLKVLNICGQNISDVENYMAKKEWHGYVAWKMYYYLLKNMTWICCMKYVLLFIVSEDDMKNWLAKIVDDVDSLHFEIENIYCILVEFCFIRGIHMANHVYAMFLFGNTTAPSSNSSISEAMSLLGKNLGQYQHFVMKSFFFRSRYKAQTCFLVSYTNTWWF